MMGLIKALASGLGIIELWSKYFGDQQKQKIGAELQKGKQDEETIKRLVEVSRPGTTAESDKLWDDNKAKFGRTDRPE